MSLESSVSDLVTVGKDLIAVYTGKINAINKAVADAIAAVPSTYKRFYVNQVTGVDTADGSVEAPLKTIAKALANTPRGGFCDVVLQADYQMTTSISVDGRVLSIYSDTTGVKRKLKSVYYPTSDGTSGSYLASFLYYNGGQVLLTDITVVFPSPAGVVPALTGGTRNAFFTSNAAGGTPLVMAKMSSCEVEAAADWNGWIIGANASAVIFEVTGTTFPSNFGGRYVWGSAAGSNPATLTNVLTNLQSL